MSFILLSKTLQGCHLPQGQRPTPCPHPHPLTFLTPSSHTLGQSRVIQLELSSRSSGPLYLVFLCLPHCSSYILTCTHTSYFQSLPDSTWSSGRILCRKVPHCLPSFVSSPFTSTCSHFHSLARCLLTPWGPRWCLLCCFSPGFCNGAWKVVGAQ